MKPLGEAPAPSRLGFLAWRGTTPHRVTVLQLGRLQRVLVITVQCKTREPKREPREGTDLSGPYRVSLARVQLEHYPSTTLPRDNVDNSRILFECDIGATPNRQAIGRNSPRYSRPGAHEKEPRPQVARALPLPLKGKALGELR